MGFGVPERQSQISQLLGCCLARFCCDISSKMNTGVLGEALLKGNFLFYLLGIGGEVEHGR